MNIDLKSIKKWEQVTEQVFEDDVPLNIDDLDGINYCELVIDKHGNMLRLHGSHSSVLEYLLAKKFDCTMSEAIGRASVAHWSEYVDYLLEETEAVIVRYEQQIVFDDLNAKQKRTMHDLVINKKINGNLLKLTRSVID